MNTWQQVDEALRSIADRRAALDAEEARWLREAELLQLWRPLGMVSILDYMERRLGERCNQGWQGGMPISAAAVDRASCDAEHIGNVHAETPARAHQDVSPAVARLVWARDQGRCTVPGCRSRCGLEIHHLRHREHGGGHEPDNLALLCSSCHIAHHEGRITISGTPGAIEVVRSHVGLKRVAAHIEAKDALVALGWKRSTASTAVEQAITEVGDAPLEQVIRSALRHCWQPETFAPS